MSEGVDVRGYPYLNLVRGALLEELGRFDEARAAFVTAQHHARNAAERAQIGQRMAKLDERAGR